MLAQGRIMGLVPKTHIPNYGEFYEARWFASGAAVASDTARLCGCETDFGRDLTFEVNGAEFAIELCEDLWSPRPLVAPAPAGARVVFNLSASPEAAGKHAYVRSLVAQQSARHDGGLRLLLGRRGRVVHRPGVRGQGLRGRERHDPARGGALSAEEQLVTADVDLRTPRRRTPPHHHLRPRGRRARHHGHRAGDPREPASGDARTSARRAALRAGRRAPQRSGARRSSPSSAAAWPAASHHTACRKAVIGISGGLDSTLALLATVRTFDRLGLDRRGIVGITMPGFGTSTRTHGNAVELMRELGVTAREIPIGKACEQHFADIGLDPADRSAAYENGQARERTQILMDTANMEGLW